MRDNDAIVNGLNPSSVKDVHSRPRLFMRWDESWQLVSDAQFAGSKDEELFAQLPCCRIVVGPLNSSLT